jgi:uncharacterized membrane protein
MMLILNLDNTYSVTFKPNSSLTADGKLKVILLLSVIPCLIGIGFSAMGVWLVMPFVGIELLALAYAFYYVNTHEGDYETITIDGDKLKIETCIQGQVKQQDLNVYWTKLVQRELENGELHLGFISHGKEINVGKYLTRAQRETIAVQLKKRMALHRGV